MSDPWYRRFPTNFLLEAMELSLEEKGAFAVIVDLLYVTGNPVRDDPRAIAGLCGCTAHKWKRIREHLIVRGKLVIVSSGLDAPIVHKWANWSGRETIPAYVRREVLERDGACCVYCGSVDGPFHLDHVIPASRGGASRVDNLVVACLPCNLSKGAKTPSEWRQ